MNSGRFVQARRRRAGFAHKTASGPQGPVGDIATSAELDERRFSAEVSAAWNDLRDHPMLQWVPPMWRAARPTTAASEHALRAIEMNLIVMVEAANSQVSVRLATGPLQDKIVSDGVDPVIPAVSVDPKLSVAAPTFEEALVELRNVVVHTYGPVSQARGATAGIPTAGPSDGLARVHSIG